MAGDLSFLGISSGIDFQSLLDALMVIERRPILRIEKEIDKLELRRDAYNDVNNRLDNLLEKISPLVAAGSDSTFNRVTASSSNESVLTATADSTAAPGVYDVRVKNLAQAHQVIAAAGATISPFTSRISGGDLNPNIDPATTRIGSLHRRDDGTNFAAADLGRISIDDGNGAVVVDLSGLDPATSTFQDLLDKINADLAAGGSTATAALNATGNGVVINSGTGSVSVADADAANTATKLGIATTGGVASPVDGGDLDPDLQTNTPLSVLNAGSGVGDLASGVVLRSGTSSATLDFSAATTVQDVLDVLNASGMSVSASIGASKDGIDVSHTVANRSLAIDENGGTTALDLGIVGEDHVVRIKQAQDAAFTRVFLNGGFDGDNANLSQADVRDSINRAAPGATASLVDGRLVITSDATGADGKLEFRDDAPANGILEQLGILISDPLDDATLSTAFSTDQTQGGEMTAASDATFSVNGLVLTRSKNTGINDVITGVTIDLVGVSKATGPNFPADYESTTLTVKKDDAKVKQDIRGFVDQYNSVLDFLDDVTKIDTEGDDDGPLAADATARSIGDLLFAHVSDRLDDDSLAFRSLFEVTDSDGNAVFELDENNRLTVNEAALDDVLSNNRKELEKLFAYDSDGDGTKDAGILFDLQEYVKTLAKDGGSLDEQADVMEDLIRDKEDAILRREEILEIRRAALERQFAAAEAALSQLKAQQTAFSNQLSRLE